MIDKRPEPGSAWERHCPDAWPRSWLDNGMMPDGFTRPATQDESDLITGRISERLFLHRTGKLAPSCVPSSSPTKKATAGKRKLSPVMRKLFGWNRFLDALANREPRLHPVAVALWCWLWRCERKGHARASERKLAARFGVCRDNIRSRLDELTEAGFLTVARRGVHGKTSTIYRIRPVPKKPPLILEST